MDVSTKKIDHIPSLQSSENSVPPELERGINSIEINPSRTLLATGASNSNDVAVYRYIVVLAGHCWLLELATAMMLQYTGI